MLYNDVLGREQPASTNWSRISVGTGFSAGSSLPRLRRAIGSSSCYRPRHRSSDTLSLVRVPCCFCRFWIYFSCTAVLSGVSGFFRPFRGSLSRSRAAFCRFGFFAVVRRACLAFSDFFRYTVRRRHSFRFFIVVWRARPAFSDFSSLYRSPLAFFRFCGVVRLGYLRFSDLFRSSGADWPSFAILSTRIEQSEVIAAPSLQAS